MVTLNTMQVRLSHSGGIYIHPTNLYLAFSVIQLSANHARRMNLLTLPKDQRELLVEIGYKDKLDAVDEGIRR